MTQAVEAPGVAEDEADPFGIADEVGTPAVLDAPAPATVVNNNYTGPAVLDSIPQSAPATSDAEASASPVQGSVGGWVLKVTPKHTCIKPTIDAQTFVGSIWQCGECEEFYIVAEKRGKDAGTKVFRKLSAEKAKEKLAIMGDGSN